MRNVIIGTAGHVDHGKTTLITALTGKDTDRLKEEKQRGITIELGFADMQGPDGTDIGIIDVPGHEKFIKNMLAGIGGIDMVLLVVAADEGVMPQTTEHLDIMRLLNIKRGIIVITKADTADSEWLEMVESDIRSACGGTFLENAPCIAVSSISGHNIPQLRQMIFDMISEVEEKNNNPELLRIPIDRVFTISGFGTVITGTLLEGMIRQGQEVAVYPSGIKARVRNLQVHGNMVEAAYAGQRTAVNLTGIKKEDIQRGNVLACTDSIHPSVRIDVRLNMLSDSKRSIKSGDLLHFYYGSDEAICRITLLDSDLLTSGNSCYAQLYFDDCEVSVKQNDLFVVRYFSPLETIGGGVVLNTNAPRHKKSEIGLTDALRVKESGDDRSVAEQVLKESAYKFTKKDAIAKQTGISRDEMSSFLEELVSKGKALSLTDDIYIHIDYVNKFVETCLDVLKEYHSRYALTSSMPKEELKSRLLAALKIAPGPVANILLERAAENGAFSISENSVKAAGFEVTYTPSQQKAYDDIYNYYHKCGYEAPELEDALSVCADKSEGRQLVLALAGNGLLTRLTPTVLIDSEYLNKAIDYLRDTINSKGSITLGDFRDAIGSSRKYALMILDYTDSNKITKKVGDDRVLF